MHLFRNDETYKKRIKVIKSWTFLVKRKEKNQCIYLEMMKRTRKEKSDKIREVENDCNWCKIESWEPRNDQDDFSQLGIVILLLQLILLNYILYLPYIGKFIYIPRENYWEKWKYFCYETEILCSQCHTTKGNFKNVNNLFLLKVILLEM